jgi:hypothetical protein
MSGSLKINIKAVMHVETFAVCVEKKINVSMYLVKG